MRARFFLRVAGTRRLAPSDAAVCRSLVLVFAVVAGDAAEAFAQTSPPATVTVEQILKAWNDRQDRVQSLRIRFTEERVLHRKNNRVLNREHEVVIEGLRLRHERGGENWVDEAEEVISERAIEVFDGERNIAFLGREAATDRLHSVAFVNPGVGDKARRYSQAYNQEIWPIFHTFRIRQPRFIPSDVGGWRLTGRVGTVTGHRCPILEQTRVTQQPNYNRVWVDPQSDFCAVRLEMGRADQSVVFAQLDIEYEWDASEIWVPKRWTNLVHGYLENRLVLERTSRFTVTEFALNPPIEDAAFQVKFPPGTEVMDYSGASARTYLVRESGDRPILDEERLRGARYSDFVATETGDALKPPGDAALTWRWLLVGLALAVLGWLALRRR